MKKNNNICIDIDGTITSPYHFIKYLNKMTGKNITEDEYISTDWNVIYGTEFSQQYRDFDQDFGFAYEEAEIEPDAKSVIEKIKFKGNNIYFVTARDKCVENVTKKWLDAKDIYYDKLKMLGGNEGKVPAAKELDCDLFIEDDPDNAIKLAQAGIKVILIKNNYNKNIKHDNITMVNNWKDISDIFGE